MSCSQLQLQSVQSHIGNDNLANILEANLKVYYDWALLCIGGWSEVDIPTEGVYGGDYSKLRLVSDPNYDDGQVWEAARKDFVWEQNIDYVDVTGGTINPQAVGTPVVNGLPTVQSYYVNYPEGQIIFDSPLSTSSTVYLEYSYRYAQIYRADDVPWWQELQFQSHRVDNTQFTQVGTGEWAIFGQNRVQMPTVIIESVPRGTSRGYELGSYTKEASRDVLFHIYADNRSDRNNLMDIFNLQSDRSIPLFDNNLVIENNGFPLDYRGELINNNGYLELVDVTGYRWKNCFMQNSIITDVGRIHPSLYTAVVRTTMTVIV